MSSTVSFRSSILSTALVVALAVVAVCGVQASAAQAAAVSCAQTTDPSTPATASAGHPCWSDVTPYPFGSDGQPAAPGDQPCGSNLVLAGQPCELQVTSMAFRAWNQGLAATCSPPSGAVSCTSSSLGANVAFGVWHYNGTNWFPDPSFPGSAACPGNTVLWAGKLDYWLVGGATQTLCRFDGVDQVWEELPLPPGSLARLQLDPNTGKREGGITTGACYAWNNCSFFGTDGIEVHWDGQVLTDASPGLGVSPWLGADFTGAVAETGPAGNEFGLAVTSSSQNTDLHQGGEQPVAAQPDGSAPPQLFGSDGGSFAPLSFSPPTTPQPGDPFRTDLVAVASDPQGDTWAAAKPTDRLPEVSGQQPAPLLRLTGAGAPVRQCDQTFTDDSVVATLPPGGVSYVWNALSVFPNDGSALAGGQYQANTVPEPVFQNRLDTEPVLVRVACGQPPSVTRFVAPDPFSPDPATAPLIPADLGGFTAAVAANADNDAWAATTGAQVSNGSLNNPIVFPQVPHLYHWTDWQPPDAPKGDDNESRPSLFTLGPPVFVQAPPTVVVPSTTTTTTTKKRPKPKKRKLKPAIYAVSKPRLSKAHGQLTLYISFKVRRPVRVGLKAYRGNQVVASSGVKRFTGHSGRLALRLDRKRWPTRLAFITPKT